MIKSINRMALSALMQIFMLCTIQHAYAQDIYSDDFSMLIDSLTETNQNELLYGKLIEAGDKAANDNNFKIAHNYYSKALSCAQSLDNTENAIDCLMKMSEANYGREFYGTGIRQLEQAENLARDNRLDDKLMDVTEAQWRLYEGIGDIGNAYKYFKRSTQFKQQQYEEQYDELVTQLQLQDSTFKEPAKKGAKKEYNTVRVVKKLEIPNLPLLIVVGLLSAGIVTIALFSIRAHRKALSDKDIANRNSRLNEIVAPEYASLAERLRDEAHELYNRSRKSDNELKADLAKLGYDSQQVALLSRNIASLLSNPTASTVESNTVDIDALLKRCIRHYTHAAEIKGIKIEYISAGRFDLECDEDLIGLTIDNLLSNAVKFSSSGDKVALWIESADGTATVAVEDHGAGMSHEQIDDATKGRIIASSIGTDDEKGAGIGLEVCREAIRINGGRVIIKSSEKGTVVGFRVKI